MKISLSRAAKRDIVSHWVYLAQNSVDVADCWRAKVFAAMRTLEQTPRIGHARSDLTEQAVLFWPVESHLILYRLGRRRVEVLAVVHGSRDIPSLLESRGVHQPIHIQ